MRRVAEKAEDPGALLALSGGDGLPRLALTKREAAEALGMSEDSFDRHVRPELRMVRRGALRLVPVRELDRWLEQNAERAGAAG